MIFELVYDVATTSEAPRYALLLTVIAVVATLSWLVWLRSRDKPIRIGLKLLIALTVVLILLTAGSFYEQRLLANRTDARSVEGPVTGVWRRSVRRSGTPRSYWELEGFSLEGVPFAYVRNLEQNFFHNAGSRALDLRDGMRLRVRYIQERDGDNVRNQILRVERAVE